MTDNGVAYKGSAQAGSYQEEHAVLTAYTLQPAASPARDAGLFDCFADMETCCLGYFCPCLLFGQSLRRARLTKTTRAGCGIYMLPSMVISILTFFLVYGLGKWRCRPWLAAPPGARAGPGAARRRWWCAG